jgi:hypothetical protein
MISLRGAATLDASKIGSLELQQPAEPVLLAAQAHHMALDRHRRPFLAGKATDDDLLTLMLAGGHGLCHGRPVEIVDRLLERGSDHGLLSPLVQSALVSSTFHHV